MVPPTFQGPISSMAPILFGKDWKGSPDCGSKVLLSTNHLKVSRAFLPSGMLKFQVLVFLSSSLSRAPCIWIMSSRALAASV